MIDFSLPIFLLFTPRWLEAFIGNVVNSFELPIQQMFSEAMGYDRKFKASHIFTCEIWYAIHEEEKVEIVEVHEASVLN